MNRLKLLGFKFVIWFLKKYCYQSIKYNPYEEYYTWQWTVKFEEMIGIHK